jgi:hypothetical protein
MQHPQVTALRKSKEIKGTNKQTNKQREENNKI